MRDLAYCSAPSSLLVGGLAERIVSVAEGSTTAEYYPRNQNTEYLPKRYGQTLTKNGGQKDYLF